VTNRDRVRTHVEKYLGPIGREWAELESGQSLPFSVVEVKGSPVVRTTSLVTVGFSDAILRFPSGRPTRQELVLAYDNVFAQENTQGLIARVGLDRIESGRAVARGETIGPNGRLFPSSRLEALYGALPVYFPEHFGVSRETDPPTNFLWLVPVGPNEVRFVRECGWEAFEDLMVKTDPDLLDMDRREIDLPEPRAEQ
jgi:hypothetical protein